MKQCLRNCLPFFVVVVRDSIQNSTYYSFNYRNMYELCTVFYTQTHSKVFAAAQEREIESKNDKILHTSLRIHEALSDHTPHCESTIPSGTTDTTNFNSQSVSEKTSRTPVQNSASLAPQHTQLFASDTSAQDSASYALENRTLLCACGSSHLAFNCKHLMKCRRARAGVAVVGTLLRITV